ncbi:MAG: hypothetical protein JST33_01350 [Actinobacteria bacterium]|nr:hypothetical protein [Actinomycetota bacterium]
MLVLLDGWKASVMPPLIEGPLDSQLPVGAPVVTSGVRDPLQRLMDGADPVLLDAVDADAPDAD